MELLGMTAMLRRLPSVRNIARRVLRRAKVAVRLGVDRLSAPQGTIKLTFIIPLIGKARAGDWDITKSNLEKTLISIHSQNIAPSQIKIIICGQDDPELSHLYCYEFLKYKTSGTGHYPEKNDQWDKIKFLFEYIKATKYRGYVMQIDADDLVHPNFAQYILEHNNRHGYVVEMGFMYDASNNAVGVHSNRSLEFPRCIPFNKYCGSCNIFFVNYSSYTNSFFYDRIFELCNNHKTWHKDVQGYRFKIDVIPFFACVYVVNHGTSISEQKGKFEMRAGYISRNPVRDPNLEAELRQAFKLPALTKNDGVYT